MLWMFAIATAVTLVAAALVVTGRDAVHAVLYLVVAMLGLAVDFFALGAPFAALLQVIVYAGAVLVLFVFVVMMLNLGPKAVVRERRWLRSAGWAGPALLAAVLLVTLCYGLLGTAGQQATGAAASAREVGALLFGPYLLAVELASLVLLAAAVGATHLGRRGTP